ncbi:hypothetical protein ACFYTF_10260 [Nocardia thailandica]|uniref:Uncharacterized protein n=1 Tax=Nocardia thailandica TaxID=257275 RepID=A0ABW6PLP1_9NOCA
MTDPEPVLDVARGDVAVSRQVSAALRVIAAGSGDATLKQQITEILAGRASVREFARTESFNRILDTVLPTAMNKLTDLPQDELQRLAEQGRADIERYRYTITPDAPIQPATPAPSSPSTPDTSSPAASTPRAVVAGSRKPNREQIVGPSDDLDEDDRYFQDRRNRGWLQ